jgi:BirA family transcriptional regulator, biotin operon repressor / biotin---[acetyl-CoA-carboxylase] ligase
MADRQTAGRGRLGRHWSSPKGNLYASTIVRLRAGDPDAATIALVAAVALFDTLAIWTSSASLQLKWPNDVLGGGTKLSGILLERHDSAVVVGFGVNLATHPEALNRPVTSLVGLGVVPPEPSVFVEALAEGFERWVALWRNEGLPTIRNAWLDRAHPVGTALIANLPDGGAVEGLFDGLTDDCALRLRLPAGDIRVIHAGDVFLI